MAARRTAGTERMSKVDTAWLRMDSPDNLMLIVGVWTMQPAVRYEDLCRRVQERLLPYDRFRQRVRESGTGYEWVDAEVDVAHHVVRERLPRHAPGGREAALQRRIAQLSMQPLAPDRPLWQMHLVEDYNGGSALVTRIHHCIADGIALMGVTLSLVDGGKPPPAAKRRTRPADEDWLDHLVRPLTGFSVQALEAAGRSTVQALGLFKDPHQGVAGSLDAARMAYQVVNDAAALLFMPDDTPTRLKGKPSGAKRVAWCPPLPLDEVRAVGKALNCSINDVLLSCVAGALAAYLESVGEPTAGVEIRAMVPVNLRPLEDQALGNRFGLVPLVLPLGIPNPIERVYEVRRRMQALKGSTQPMLAFAVLTVAGLLVKQAQDVIMDMFRRKTTAIVTNVPGPRGKLQFLGATLEQVMFWVPQSGDIGLGISVLSYGGGVQFGVMTDTRLCPEPQAIIDRFAPEFDKLALLMLMLPWDEGGAAT